MWWILNTWKVTVSIFKDWKIENHWKFKWSRGHTCQLHRPLNRVPRSLRAHAQPCCAPCRSPATAVVGPLPPPRVRPAHPYPHGVVVQRSNQFSLLPLTAATNSCPNHGRHLHRYFFDRCAPPMGFWPRHSFPCPRAPPTSRSPIPSVSSTLKASPLCSPLRAPHRHSPIHRAPPREPATQTIP
jgi:hypothetical protein